MNAPAEALWVDGLTMGEALRRVAAEQPEAEALVFPRHGFRATYAEYDAAVDAAARGLLALGIGAGDHVAVWSTNRPEWILLQLATARIGAVLVTVNPAFHEDELLYVLHQSDARALFLTDEFKASDYFATVLSALPELASSTPGTLNAEAAPELRWVVSFPAVHPGSMLSWQAMLERGAEVSDDALATAAAKPQPDEPINLQYTSGTTGFPKGALLSHRNLLLNGWYVGDRQLLGPGDRVCSPVPLYHCFGCVIGVVATMLHGAALLVPSEYFTPGDTLDCIEAERATAIYGVPTMFIALLEHETYARRDLSSLRTGVMAGAPCPVELMRRVVGEMGARQLTIAYGLTETSPGATQTLPDDTVEQRVETVGKALDGVQVRITDPDTGEPCADGVQGEVCIRGHNVMLGYYKMPEATADAIDAEGWLHSGDLGVRDAAGYVRITGRIKDMVIRGGENLYPREIEEVLYQHPDVEAAEVIGVPDDRFGEELCACVKLHAGSAASAADLRRLCAGELAHFKVPRYVMFVEQFPTTVTGKVQKFVLRDIAVERLAAGTVDDARQAG
jgi:fatty-acyl-CoA synthase